jgi:hypothetical protein
VRPSARFANVEKPMLGLEELYEIYKAWQTTKKSIKKVTESGWYQILNLSFQVDDLVRDYERCKKGGRDDDALASIRTRLGHVKDTLIRLATTAPKPPIPHVSVCRSRCPTRSGM